MTLYDYLLADVKGLGKALGLTRKELLLILDLMSFSACPLIQIAEFWMCRDNAKLKRNRALEWSEKIVSYALKRKFGLKRLWCSGTVYEFQPYARQGSKLWRKATGKYCREVLNRVIETLSKGNPDEAL